MRRAMLQSIGGVVISPNDLPNLALWYDGTDPSSMTLSGSDVSAMTDKSPNAVVITNGSANPDPVYDGSKIIFTSGDGGLGGATNPYINGDIHGFIVFSGWQASSYIGNRSSSTNRLSIGMVNAGALGFTKWNGGWNSALINNSTPMPNNTYILEIKVDTGVPSGFFDGSALSYSNSGGVSTPTANYFNLGGRAQYEAYDWSFYEMFFSSTILTTEERDGILNYLANKY